MGSIINKYSVACLCLLIAACSSTARRDQPREYLDQQTAATVTVVDQPLVFARERPEFAANVRDYVTLAAAAVNRSGKVSYALLAYFWSTVDARGATGASVTDKTPVIVADDRRILLKTPERSARDAGIGAPLHAPPGMNATPMVFTTDLATLRFMASARQLSVRAGNDVAENAYELWSDQRSALLAFVNRMKPHERN